MSQQTLYEKYGGFAKINRIVMAFYDALLDSDEVGPYFDEVDMKRLIDHQTKFVSSLLGGPASFNDEQLRRAHASLAISDPHFEEMGEILQDTLAEHGVEPDDVATIMAAIEERRGLIVTA